jgi:hypothetical protein
MTYSYTRKSFPRRRRPAGRGSGAAGWIAVAVLVIAIGALWWVKSERTPEDASIISSPVATNNPSAAAVSTPETQTTAAPGTSAGDPEAQSMTLTLKGFTVWGVQFGAYGTQQAAQQAGGQRTAVFFEQQRYRVIDSLWQQKEDAQAYRQGISQESYVTELTAPSVKLKLTGSQQKLDAIAQAVQSWEAALTSLLEAQQSLTTEEASLDKAKQYAQTASEQLKQARAGIPDETEVLKGMRGALEESEAALGEILALKPGEEVDFEAIFRYNILICYNIYNTYANNLLSS